MTGYTRTRIKSCSHFQTLAPLPENGDRLHPLPTGVSHQGLVDDGAQPVQEFEGAESYQVIKSST